MPVIGTIYRFMKNRFFFVTNAKICAAATAVALFCAFLSDPLTALADGTSLERGGVALLLTADVTSDVFAVPGGSASAESSTPAQDASDVQALAIAHATGNINIRSGAGTDFDIVGKLQDGDALTVLGRCNDWLQIQSGEVTGYVSAEFVIEGQQAAQLLSQVVVRTATVEADRLNIRSEANTESSRIGSADAGEALRVLEDDGDWVKISCGGKEGFVSAEFVTVTESYPQAKSMAQLEAEEAARKAEEARIAEEARKVAEAKKAEEARLAAAAAAQAQQAADGQNEPQIQDAPVLAEAPVEETPAIQPANTDNATTADLRASIIEYAMQYLGHKYVRGGQSLESGTDCSGFTCYVLKEFGYSLSRTPSGQYKGNGRSITLAEAQPGDIVCYGSGSCTHVAFYIGNNQILHAANSRRGVVINEADYQPILGVKNVID